MQLQPAAKMRRDYESLGSWGMLTSIDLHQCDAETIRSADKIRQFTVALCDLIKVIRFGEPTIVHFGEQEAIAGYSLVQLIETSLVSGHFANATNNVYLDIFSCAYYDAQAAVDFSKKFFGARDATVHTILRQ